MPTARPPHGSGRERECRGVYRLARYPLSPLGQYMEAVLWPQARRPGARGVVSHVVLHDRDEDLARALERAAVAGDYQGFAFWRKEEPIHLENGTVSMELAVTYRGDVWTSITVDVARAEPGEAEVELVPAIALASPEDRVNG